MKIIFDENVPWPLRQLLPGHDITSVQREGFSGTENGELLALLDGYLIGASQSLSYLPIAGLSLKIYRTTFYKRSTTPSQADT